MQGEISRVKMPNYYEPLFIKSDQKQKFKKKAQATGKTMVDLFDEEFIEDEYCIWPPKKKKMNKKGNAFIEGAVIIMGVFILLVAIGVLYTVMSPVYTDLTSSFTAAGHTEAAEVITNQHNSYHLIWDGAILFLFAMFWLGAIISAFFIDSHPIFFFVSMLIVVPVLIVGSVLSVAFNEIVSDPDLSSIVTNFPMSSWVINNILLLAVAVTASVALALYIKIKILGENSGLFM